MIFITGTFAVISLMLGSAMEKHLNDDGAFIAANGTETEINDSKFS